MTWYALHTPGGCENKYKRILIEQNVTTYVPSFTSYLVRNSSTIAVSRPLFPAYIFTDQVETPLFKIRDFNLKYVSVNGKPAAISQKVINDVVQIEMEIAGRQPFKEEVITFSNKDLVVMSEGLLIGRKGIIVRISTEAIGVKLLDTGYVASVAPKSLLKIC